EVANHFDEQLRQNWPLAEVGFVVSLEGNVICPSLFGRAQARRFRLDNDKFLCNRESVEVYWNSPKGQINLSRLDDKAGGDSKETGMKDGAPKKSGMKGDDDGKSGPGGARFRQV